MVTAFGVTIKTANKLLERFRADETDGLRDRSSRPIRLRSPTLEYVVVRIETMRRARWSGRQIAPGKPAFRR